MNYKNYHYCETGTGRVVRIRCKRKPSVNTQPYNGCWNIQEVIEGSFKMPYISEITLGTINKRLLYLGYTNE